MKRPNSSECPVPTIDWHTRTGRIKRRPHAGSRPSLSRESVEDFATWYRERQEAKAQRREDRKAREELRRLHRERAAELGIRPGRIPPLEPDSTGWLTTHEAAALMGTSTATVTRLIHRGDIRAVRIGSRWWLDEQSVRGQESARSSWVSFADAAALAHCSEQAIKTAVRAGAIEQRDVHRTLPSLNRASVEAWARTWTDRRRRPVGGQ